MVEKKLKQIGEVFNYFKNIQVIAVKAMAPMKVGDKIRIKGGEKDVEMTIESMQVQGKNVEKVKKGDEVGIKVLEDVHKGYRVYKAE